MFLSLWDGYDAGVLRFQIIRLISGEKQSIVRGSQRAPTHTPVRILAPGRKKEGSLYSISNGGCFIESSRASMEGARLWMFFVLDHRSFDLEGVVVVSNGPGNLQHPNLPLDMGVQFEHVAVPTRQSLHEFIDNRMDSLEI
ncbi:MAG: PilZ domain-containing protein [Proteobacteria bacterium]|nr:PilZ domain-containing protein [Pseudomonadota bacterium]